MEANNTLVLQSDLEKVLTKLNSLKEKREADEIEECFACHFNELRLDTIEISRDQLKKFDKKEIGVLADIVAQKAKPWAKFQIGFSAFFALVWSIALITLITTGESVVPLSLLAPLAISAWIPSVIMLGNAESLHYLYYRRRLKKIYGENYFSRISFKE